MRVLMCRKAAGPESRVQRFVNRASFATALMVGLALVPLPALAQTQGQIEAEPTVTITGTATLQVPADSGTLTIRWTLGAARGDAQKAEDDKAVAALDTLLRNAGAPAAVLRFTDEEPWVYARSDSPQDRQRVREVKVTLSGRSTITAALGQLRNHPIFEVSDADFECTCRDEAERRAEALAFGKARQSAEALATAAGGQVRGLVAISNQPYGFGLATQSATTGSGMPLEEASITTRAAERVSTVGRGLQVPLLEVNGMVFTVWKIGR